MNSPRTGTTTPPYNAVPGQQQWAEAMARVAYVMVIGVARVWRWLWCHVRRAQDRRAAVRALAALDDRMLKDIGITRADIPSIVAGLPRLADDLGGAERTVPAVVPYTRPQPSREPIKRVA